MSQTKIKAGGFDVDVITGTDALTSAPASTDEFLISDAGVLKRIDASLVATSFAGIDDQSSSNDDQLTITDTAVVINEDSDDVDFRVESNGNANMLVVNGGGDRVGIASDPDLGTGLHIKTSDSGASVAGDMDELVIENGSANAGLSILTATDGMGRIAFGDSGDNSAGNVDYDHGSDFLRFGTAGSERFRLHNTSSASFHTTSALGGVHILSNSGDSTSHGTLTITANNTGTATGIMFFDGQSQACGRISVVGGSNEISVITSSDYRLKQDIVDMDSAWDTIKSIKPRKFKWKANISGGFNNGFIADELQSVVPEAAYGVKDATKTITKGVFRANGNMMAENIEEADWTAGKISGEYPSDSTWSASKEVIDPQGVNSQKLIPHLIKALQESQTRIETLEAKVKTLEE